MTRLLLARHAESEYNTNGLLQGRIDADLTENGVEQAKQLADCLATEDVAAVYSSNMVRSRKTAEHIAASHDLEPEPLTELVERSFGVLEDRPIEERNQLVREQNISLDDLQPEGGETLNDVRDRVFPTIMNMRKQHEGETVVVVGHTYVNRAIIMAALGTDSGHGHRIYQDNACINELEYDEFRGWRLKHINDATHLT